MKKLTLCLAVLTMLFPAPIFAEWTRMTEDAKRGTHLGFERIRKHDRHVYWWDFLDYLKQKKHEHLSAKVYVQGDCKLFRIKRLSVHMQKRCN